MATPSTQTVPKAPSTDQISTMEDSVHSHANTITQHKAQAESNDNEKTTAVSHPIRTYTRSQILFLYNSPLVQLPPEMPELREWFGDNDHNPSKKDTEPATPNGARDRRFRREAEDGELPSRPTFRSTLSQPSQMGNFKHHSLRPNDRDRERDRERDGEKDRQRDIRDKEGQEKLRHLSDKYDRERNKERDTAPHLVAGSTSRLAIHSSQAPIVSSRRAETREAVKKKAGEASEDWRRGAEPRPLREDRSDNGRRDERDRPRSHARDPSRSRREPSSSRREREDKDKPRERERDRDDTRRDRDLDRDSEADDPRRWRDDGKRDERLAARRGDKHVDQHRDRDRVRERDTTWDASGDRRWTVVEERDGRTKRTTGRERKAGPVADDSKERDERKDRDREKEKEPAWMDTYVPHPSSTGILGGKSADGGLDGIQAWKKGMKEKELKDKSPTVTQGNGGEVNQSSTTEPDGNGKQLDEIQLFKLLMKREEEKKKNDLPDAPLNGETSQSVDKTAMALAKLQLPQVAASNDNPINTGNVTLTPRAQTEQYHNSHATPTAEHLPSSAGILPHTLPSAISPKESSDIPSNSTSEPPPPAPRAISSHTSQNSIQNPEPTLDPVSSQFNPSPGSRLLAFARPSASAIKTQSITNNVNVPLNGNFSQQGPSKVDSLRPLSGFSPFEDQSHSFHGPEDHREQNSFINSSETHLRGPGERLGFSPTEINSLQEATLLPENGTGYSTGKGSRFAKFFDGKGRENAPTQSKVQSVGYISSPSPGLRQDNGNFNGSLGTDHRTMDDIYAMLNSSAQGQRHTPVNQPNTAALSSNISFGQHGQSNMHILQHQQLHPQHQQHQQQIQTSRLEPLYESRLGLDDRNFMPDGMVPGLRSAPPPRNRENVGMYPDVLDDSMHFNIQRHPQQRGVDQLYSGPPPPMYTQPSRNTSIPLQQSNYRGGPSPVSNQQSSLPNAHQQRLPPGLANLGGRPPHEPSQFLGMPSPGVHGSLHLSAQAQQPFNNFTVGNNLGYGGGPQIRGPHPMQNPMGHHLMGGMGPNNMDPRAANQSQLLGMGGVNIGGLRSGFPGQQGPTNSMQGHILAMRQQQVPPHMVQHVLPPHIQQQQGLGGPNTQPAHDLMALLMAGSHRE